MTSTASSDVLLKVSNLKVHYELEHYHHQGLRDVFVSALTHPMEFLFRMPEIFYVLDDVSFELRRGTRLGLIGVNGSGKTTLCRCIAGMIHAQQGKIETQAEVRAIFDTGTGIQPELTGRENAWLLARLFFPDVEDLGPIVNESIEFADLGHFIDIPFRQYSKGMQSRLMLSLISSKPTDLLILDEVFDGADVFFQEKLSIRMKSFIEKAGATIFVSHSFDQIRQVCNQVMVFHKGKIAFMGDVDKGIEEYLRLEKGP